MTAPYKPTTSLGNLVERLRRAFNLVGDVPVQLGEAVTMVVNAEDLTEPGYGTYRRRRFLFSMDCAAAAANTYRAFKAADTVVITALGYQCDTAGFTTIRLVPAAVADPAGWNFNTPVPFCDRSHSATDYAPVSWMSASSLNAPASAATLATPQNQTNFTVTPWLTREGIVLLPGDRLAVLSSAAVGIGKLMVEGYVF